MGRVACALFILLCATPVHAREPVRVALTDLASSLWLALLIFAAAAGARLGLAVHIRRKSAWNEPARRLASRLADAAFMAAWGLAVAYLQVPETVIQILEPLDRLLAVLAFGPVVCLPVMVVAAGALVVSFPARAGERGKLLKLSLCGNLASAQFAASLHLVRAGVEWTEVVLLVVLALLGGLLMREKESRQIFHLHSRVLTSGPVWERMQALGLSTVLVSPSRLPGIGHAVWERSVCLTRGLIEGLGRREFDGVVTRELLHVKHRHPLKLVLVFFLSAGTVAAALASALPGFAVAPVALGAGRICEFFVARRFEFLAVREAALVTGQPESAIAPSDAELRGQATEQERDAFLPGRHAPIFSPGRREGITLAMAFFGVVTAAWVPLLATAAVCRLARDGVVQDGGWMWFCGTVVALLLLHFLTRHAMQRSFLAGLGRQLAAWHGGEGRCAVVTFSPGANLRFHDGMPFWDMGVLSLTRNALVYSGERASFAVSRADIRSIELDRRIWEFPSSPALRCVLSHGGRSFLIRPVLGEPLQRDLACWLDQRECLALSSERSAAPLEAPPRDEFGCAPRERAGWWRLAGTILLRLGLVFGFGALKGLAVGLYFVWAPLDVVSSLGDQISGLMLVQLLPIGFPVAVTLLEWALLRRYREIPEAGLPPPAAQG